MKITIIGTINKDLILPFHDTPIESFGGIFYDVSILSQLLSENDEIYPISFVGEDISGTIDAVLQKMPNVRREGLITLPQKNHKVILEYTSPQRRREKSLFQFPPLEWKHIEPFLADSDMVIVNLISGWDIELKTMQKISEKVRNRLYLDLHYLVMDIDNLGRRSPRKPEAIEEWLKSARFVQMNETEYRIISEGYRNEVDFFQSCFNEDQILLITRASKGMLLLYERDGMIAHKTLPAFKIQKVVDTTGCGDAFGAGFVVEYIRSGDFSAAVEYAQLVAAANARLRGTNEMHRLQETMEEIKALNQLSV
ncbi:MAG: carbohydrate kinase family protein [Calditrichaeota bacterium]|nr:MAG: carbohydrate kinase family protein [Calditrichota bacterium]